MITEPTVSTEQIEQETIAGSRPKTWAIKDLDRVSTAVRAISDVVAGMAARIDRQSKTLDSYRDQRAIDVSRTVDLTQQVRSLENQAALDKLAIKSAREINEAYEASTQSMTRIIEDQHKNINTLRGRVYDAEDVTFKYQAALGVAAVVYAVTVLTYWLG